jgi:YD repeat-containing protein
MKILNGGKKDYYDYLAGIYGIDEDIVYDRSNGEVPRPFDCRGEEYLLTNVLYTDRPKGVKREYTYDDRGRLVRQTMPVGLILYFVIEVGFIQYLFSLERYLDDNGKVKLDPKLIKKERVVTKVSEAPLSLIPVTYTGWWNEAPSIKEYKLRQEIQNPIFNNTWVTSFIPAEDMYNEIYNYLIAIREPNIEDDRNDIQKLESKGFDKKTSFRNPINKRRK